MIEDFDLPLHDMENEEIAFQSQSHQMQEQVQGPDNSNQQKHPQQEFVINEDSYQVYKTMVKDLQFIQLLSNPKYILELVDRGYFKNQDFIYYITELRKRFCLISQNIHIFKYPQGLFNLEIMTRQGFADCMKDFRNRDRFVLICLERNQEIRRVQT